MTIAFTAREQLTVDEREACKLYYADATYFHATVQGWSGQFADSSGFQRFMSTCANVAHKLDTAIGKFEVSTAGTVYSGHGLGVSVIGYLQGRPEQFVGFTYSYPGYTSTSIDQQSAENFLRTRATGARLPVLLEIALRAGAKALPIDEATGQVGEAEILSPRAMPFRIADAAIIRVGDVAQDVLHLRLTQ